MKTLIGILSACTLAFCQTAAVSNVSATGAVNFGSAVATSPMQIGTVGAMPGTCSAGQMYFATNATAGANLYGCSSSDVWTVQGSGSGGSGTVTQIVFSSPLSGGTITTSGTVACATCVTSAASLALNALVLGAGSQGSSALSSLGTTTTLLHGNASGAPSYGPVSLTADVTGTLAIGSGGTGTGSSLSGIVRGGSPFTAAELNGDCTSTTGNAVTCTKVNGATWPTGSQLQHLRLAPNSGTSTTLQFSTPVIYDASDFNFAPITPVGSPSLTVSTQDVELPLAPLGLRVSSGLVDVGHYLYISGGTGTAEAALIGAPASHSPACTPGSTNCWIGITCAYTHSSAYTLSSASGGVQEAVKDSEYHQAGGGYTIHLPSGTTNIYAPIYIGQYSYETAKFVGDGSVSSGLKAQGATVGIFDVQSSDATFEDFTLLASVQQTAGGYGIRMGNGGTVSGIHISRVYCQSLYDCFLGVDVVSWTIDQSSAYQWSHTAVTAASPSATDDTGVYISNSNFFNQSMGSPADSCVKVTGTAFTMIGTYCGGSGSGQLTYGLDITTGTGTGGGFSIIGSQIQTVGTALIFMSGFGQGIQIVGNQFNNGSQNGTGILSQNGASTGFSHVTVVGNTFEGGSTSTAWCAICVTGSSTDWMIEANSFHNVQTGINLTGTGTMTVGHQNFLAYTTPIAGTNTNVLWEYPVPITFAQLPSAKAGSALYLSDSTSCTAGSGSGTTCFYNGSSWAH